MKSDFIPHNVDQFAAITIKFLWDSKYKIRCLFYYLTALSNLLILAIYNKIVIKKDDYFLYCLYIGYKLLLNLFLVIIIIKTFFFFFWCRKKSP